MSRSWHLALGTSLVLSASLQLAGCMFLDNFSKFSATPAADAGTSSHADGGGSSHVDGGKKKNDGGGTVGHDAGSDASTGACAGMDCTTLDSECAKGVCDSLTGKCKAQAVNEGKTCTNGCATNPVCTQGQCQGTSPKDCSSLDAACKVGSCDPKTGQCKADNKADSTSCSDQNPCTLQDSCHAGTCLGTQKDCSALTLGCKLGVCNPTSGDCLSMQADSGATCDDGNACTTAETCDSSGWCGNTSYANAGTICSDGNACTKNEQCDGSGKCLGGVPATVGTACSDDNECTSGETCNAQGVCAGGAAANENMPCQTKCRTSATCSSGVCKDMDGTSLNPQCTFNWCGHEHLCEIGYQNDGSCDCGCNFDDSADCNTCSMQMCTSTTYSSTVPNSPPDYSASKQCDSTTGAPSTSCQASWKNDGYCDCGCGPTFNDPDCSGKDCCTDRSSQANPAGCSDAFAQHCVCYHPTDPDLYCCTGKWDATCAKELVNLGCAICP